MCIIWVHGPTKHVTNMHSKQDDDNSITKLSLTCGRSSYQIRFQSLSIVVRIVKIFQLVASPFGSLVSIATNP